MTKSLKLMKIFHCVLQANASMIEPTAVAITVAVQEFAKVFQIRRHKGLHPVEAKAAEAIVAEADSGLRTWLISVANRGYSGCVVNEIWPTSSFMHII